MRKRERRRKEEDSLKIKKTNFGKDAKKIPLLSSSAYVVNMQRMH